jgi:hypothetical protein
MVFPGRDGIRDADRALAMNPSQHRPTLDPVALGGDGRCSNMGFVIRIRQS